MVEMSSVTMTNITMMKLWDLQPHAGSIGPHHVVHDQSSYDRLQESRFLRLCQDILLYVVHRPTRKRTPRDELKVRAGAGRSSHFALWGWAEQEPRNGE